MISHQHKCIFIHIPKTAGTSVLAKLGYFGDEKKPRAERDHRTIRDIEPVSLVHRSLSLSDVRRHYLWGRFPASREVYDSYFKFAFVRNPWDRVFSWYKNVMRDDLHQRQLGVPKDCTFNQFVRNHLENWALKTQIHWLIDSQGTIPLDFIGRFENLEEDFTKVCEILGIEDSRLPRLLIGSGEFYADNYDDETKRIVAKKYALEITFFGYEFGQ